MLLIRVVAAVEALARLARTLLLAWAVMAVLVSSRL
jgi:hypothetical protein